MDIRRLAENLRRRLAAEDGIALVLALAVSLVLALAGTSVFVYTSGNGRATRLDSAETGARAIAVAGLQQMISIVNTPTNNALDPTLLPVCSDPGNPASTDCGTVTTAEGTARWGAGLCTGLGSDPPACASVSGSYPFWLVTSTGFVRNPDAGAPAAQVVRMELPVYPTLTHELNNPAWNYIYTTHPVTPGQCDEIIQQSVIVVSPLYVNGNLCLQNTATIGAGPLDVQGSLTMFQKQNGVGTASKPISDAHLQGGCKWWNNGLDSPCRGPVDNVYAKTLDSTFVPIPPPEVYWDTWYENASPGPSSPCGTSSGPVPVFDNDQIRNDSVVSPFNLTPPVSYTCKTAGGELSWDASKLLLTVSGTIFIDGSAYIENGAVNTYTGQGTLYLSGTFLEKNSKLCASLNSSKTDCDVKSWNPNQALLGIVANGSGGIVNPNDSAQFVSSTFQGAVYATHDIDTDTTSAVLGPMLANAVNLGQSVDTSFPNIQIVPVAFPGNPTVFAQPGQPIYLAG